MLCRLELIGEAAIRIPKEVKEMDPEIAWHQIIANCKSLAQGYKINLHLVLISIMMELHV